MTVSQNEKPFFFFRREERGTVEWTAEEEKLKGSRF